MARKKQRRETAEQSKVEQTNAQSNEEKKDFILTKVSLTWVLFGAMMLATLVIRLNFLSIPFERDEGTYTYFGQLVLDGKIPYVDFYEMKLPGIYYCYALLIAIFGATLEGMHTGFLIINLATIYFMFRAGAKWFNDKVGLVIATAFSILAMNPFVSGFTTQSEHLVAFFLSAALIVMLKALEKENMKYYLFAGLLFCATMLVKQNGVFFVLFGGLAITGHYLLNKSLDWKNAFISGLYYIGGVLIPLVLVIGVISLQGAFDEFIYWIYEHPKAYVGGIEWDPQGKQLLEIAWSNISRNHYWFFMMAAGGAVITALSDLSWHKKLMIWVFGVLSFASITPGLRFYGHYWIYFMPGVAVLVGAFVYSLQNVSNKYLKGTMPQIVAFGLFVVVLLHHFSVVQSDEIIKDYYTNPNSTNVLRKVYGQNPFPESKIVGDWIKQNSTEDDRIAVLGSEPQIYFYSGRRGVSRHNYCGYLVKNTPHHSEWQKEFIADVEEAMPKYLVYFRHPVSWLTQPNVDIGIFQWFDPFANQNYELIGMTQVMSENEISYKWGRNEAAQLMNDMRRQEQALRQKMNQAAQNGDQQTVNNLQGQMQIFNFEIIVFKRKESAKPTTASPQQ